MFARAWFPGRYFAEGYWPAVGAFIASGASYRRRRLREATIDFSRLRGMVASLFPGPTIGSTPLPIVEEPLPDSVLAYLEALLRPAEAIQLPPHPSVPDLLQTPLQELADSLHTMLDREQVLAILDRDIQALEQQVRRRPRRSKGAATVAVMPEDDDEDAVLALFWLF